jgi:hypothetical protein
MAKGIAMLKTWISSAILALFLGAISQTALATPVTVQGKIVTLYGGWTVPTLMIVLDTPFINPAGCPTTDYYIISDTLAANQQLTAMAISAYSLKEKVTLVIDGCYQTRPSIIGLAFGNQ